MNLEDVKHSLLRRQLKKHFPSEMEIPIEVSTFLKDVEEAYFHYDSNEKLLERSMEISSDELYEANQLLFKELEIHKKAQEKLYNSLDTLGIERHKSRKDLLDIADILNKEIALSNEAQIARDESESKLKTVINSALDAVIVIDERGIITEWNKQAESTFGWTKDEAVGMLLSKTIIPETHVKGHETGLAHFLKTNEGPVLNKRIELPARNRKGKIFPVEISIIPNKIGNKHFFSSFVRDLTETKKSERALNAINDLAKLLLGKNTLQEITQEIVTNTAKSFGFEDCMIYIYNEETNQLDKIASYIAENTEANKKEGATSLSIKKGIIGKAFGQASPMLVNDTSKNEDYIRDNELKFSELCVPIIDDGKVIGIIDSESNKKNFFTDEHLNSLVTVANLVSAQIKNAIITLKREKTERSLRESEQRWEGLVHNQPEGILITKGGQVEYSNAAGLELYEAESIEELRKYNLWDFLDQEQLAFFKNRMSEVQQKGFSSLIEFQVKTIKGKTRIVEANSTSVIYNGEMMIQSILRDITARKEAEKSLKESEERWQSLVENLPEAVQISKNGRVIYMNPTGLKLYEVDSLDEIKGVSLLDLADTEFRTILEDRLKRLDTEGSVGTREITINTFKGNKKIIEANSTTVHYGGDQVVQTVVRDITEKKKAERELIEVSSRLSTLLNSLNTGILMEKPDRSILHTNEQIWKLFGSDVDPQEMNGVNCHNLMLEVMELFKDSQNFAEETLRLLDDKKPLSGQQFELKDGRTFERDFIPIEYDGAYLGNVWQYRDITLEKEAEKELVKALEIERNYNELNNNFVSMVSHEFRTPLTSIHSTAELLLQFGDRFTGEELTKKVERIYKSAIKIDSLIQDVLTIGKLESENSKTENSEFIFSDVLNDTVQVLRSGYLSGKNVKIIKQGKEAPIFYDQNLIELILRNLLENAGKYSPREDNIIFSYSTEKESLEIACQDFGIGIPKKDQNVIFESFKRGSNTEEIKGTGLGLPIVKKAVDKMGGTINLESEINKGTKISIKLPSQNSK